MAARGRQEHQVLPREDQTTMSTQQNNPPEKLDESMGVQRGRHRGGRC